MAQSDIYLGGGCYWGLERYFQEVKGVLSTEVGYANGLTDNPTYEEVCTDTTGYVECVHLVYDTEIAPLGFLLELFFRVIDPTSLNRQGGDKGTQYRTGIYYTKEADRQVIEDALARLQLHYRKKVVVQCLPLVNFYRAEEYHQKYLDKHPTGYCHIGSSHFEEARKASRSTVVLD